jgi:hypothetical protein
LGGFNSHLANSKEPEASSSTSSSNLDDFIDNLDAMLLPDLAQQIEKMSIFNVTSTRDALDLLWSGSNRSKKTLRSKSLSDLEDDLDLLLKMKDVGATASWEAPVFNIYSNSNEEYSLCSTTPSSWIRKGLGDEGAIARGAAPSLEDHSQPDGHTESFSGSFVGLTITSIPQGCFVYWKGFEPSELLDYKSRLVVFTQELPFQEGRPLSPIVEEGESRIELLEYCLMANHSLDRQVCMASFHNTEEDELGTQYDNEQLADLSADEPTADAPQDEDEEHRRIRRAKNAKRVQHKRNVKNRASEPRDLNNAFAGVADRKYSTLIGAIAEAALLAQQLPSNP